MSDIFGDTVINKSTDTNELAEENIEWEEVPAAGDLIEGDEVVDEADADEYEVDGDADADEAVEEEDASPDDADDADDDPLAGLEGKAPEELAKLYRDSRTEVGRQSAEVGQLRSLVETQQGQLQELIQLLSAQQDQPHVEVDLDPIVSSAFENPAGAYGQMLKLVDAGQATPDKIEEIIDAAFEVDPSMGRRIHGDWISRLATAQARAEHQEALQALQPVHDQAYRASAQEAMQQLAQDPGLGPDVREYGKEITEMFTGPDGKLVKLGSNPQEIRAKIQSALTVAIGNDPTRSSKYKQALAALKVDTQAEQGGGAGSGRQRKKTEADLMTESIFSGAKNAKVEQLFAGL